MECELPTSSSSCTSLIYALLGISHALGDTLGQLLAYIRSCTSVPPASLSHLTYDLLFLAHTLVQPSELSGDRRFPMHHGVHDPVANGLA